MSGRRTAADHNRMLPLADGRQLGWCALGDPAGRPVVYAHGFPGSRLEACFAEGPARAAGVRLLALDRPGFGRSDPHPRRGLDGWREDVAALLDALGIERAGLLGVSAGGPHALGCALHLPTRITAVALLGPLGPVDGGGGTRGMSPLARLCFRLARRRPVLQAALFHSIAAGIRLSPGLAFRLLTSELPAADRALFARPEMRRIWVESLRDSVHRGAAGAIAELRRLAAAWPFDPARIERPVAIWHGSADSVVPAAHGRRLAALIPGAVGHWPAGEGHFSLPVNHAGTALGWLRGTF
ncbi:MAG: alpha/beta fold hydrolase [Halofilum sp. (in: g-proteobacteria)]|nr:alpha/beta fold hydrolase [Halofilum sp. (in: g-proteobacteria)]